MGTLCVCDGNLFKNGNIIIRSRCYFVNIPKKVDTEISYHENYIIAITSSRNNYRLNYLNIDRTEIFYLPWNHKNARGTN